MLMIAEHKVIIKFLHFWIRFFGSVLTFIFVNLVQSQSPIFCHDLAHIWTSNCASNLATHSSVIYHFQTVLNLVSVQTTTACFIAFPDVFLPKIVKRVQGSFGSFPQKIGIEFLPFSQKFWKRFFFFLCYTECLPGSQTCHDTTSLLLESIFVQ